MLCLFRHKVLFNLRKLLLIVRQQNILMQNFHINGENKGVLRAVVLKTETEWHKC